MRPFRLSLFILLVLIIILLVFRWLATERYKPQQQELPDIVVNESTSLYKNIKHKLVDYKDTDSLFVPLGNANLALITRIKLSDEAEESLDLQYYLFHDDDSGRALLAAIVEAADRGVKVRLLIDDMDTAGREGNLIRLATEHPNLTIKVFNPIYTRLIRPIDFIARFPRSSRRMHNKSFNADSIAAVVGGRNIGNEYFSVNTDLGFLDYDVLSLGPVARDVKKEFNVYWYSGIAFDMAVLGSAAGDLEYGKWLTALNTSLKIYRQNIAKLDNLVVDKLLDNNLKAYSGEYEIIYDKPTKVLTGLFDKGDWLAPKIADLMSEASQDLFIVSPYFIPGDVGVSLFEKLREKGVTVTILTNSFSANDVVAVHSGYVDYRRKLLDIGVKLYELKPDNPNKKKHFQILGSKRSSLHAKTFLVDKRKSFIGSFNLDPRSAVHNTEMGVVFNNAEYGERAHKVATSLLKENAYEVFLSKKNQIKWRESVSDQGKDNIIIHDIEPNTTWLQRTLIGLMSWFPVEWLL